MAAAELAAMADRTGDVRLLADAVAVHHQFVNCRQDDRSPWNSTARRPTIP
jgi:hypothetical protein